MQQASLFDFGDLNGGTEPLAFADLGALRSAAAVCQRCPLAEGRTHVVVERGDPAARVMIIGEGPGQHEDETGLPFVGRAGQLLDKIVASVGWDSSRDVYICNVVKCRPPENRVPTDEEAGACRHFLLEQIRLVRPWIILLAGATAVRGVTGDKTGITKIRGQWRQWEGYWVMPIFHPSYLLRNASREQGGPKWLTWQDIQAVRAKYEELRAVAPS
ncbi:MAG: uracil-DNA glycosylase [Oscillatoriales cyanobacterium SM2_2_1]|nr:uracil-DNA glycosylase [Oscillatoriales cyanobacterium SM2_2_1]